ncbi:mannitol dehydrogenase family protein [Herbiconiux sp. P17]|uniref:mannitol dehydrogenase family protein n=1 Tax=Herbiconiux wuyangfengii TaxID=3342794 RepID=UPI0035BB85DE
MSDRVLSRSATDTRAAAPVRIVHLGLGAFHRAHQAWYTDRVDAAGEWGIAAFTGRAPAAAERLAAQDGLFTLIVRSEHDDRMELVQSISEAVDGADLERLGALVAQPATALVTLTITESGYHLGADGELDRAHPQIEADLRMLRAAGDDASAPPVTTALARLVVALDARRRAKSGPIAVVPCDNLSHNGDAARRVLLAIANEWNPGRDGGLAGWIAATVSFVSTSVDRITPRTTPDDLAAVERETGVRDEMAVVTEPFSNWILAGGFPLGRPPWELAGALVVDDIEPFENRKLWLLNGAHSLLAYVGLVRGSATVAEAFADDAVRGWVEELWQQAGAHLIDERLDVGAYLDGVRGRFRNPRIAHHLAQIAVDGSGKLRTRVVALIDAERAAGRSGSGMLRAVAAWVGWLEARRRGGALDGLDGLDSLDDSAADDIRRILGGPDDERVPGLLGLLSPAWAGDHDLQRLVRELADDIPLTRTNLQENPA